MVFHGGACGSCHFSKQGSLAASEWADKASVTQM